MLWDVSLTSATYYPSHDLKWNKNDPVGLCTYYEIMEVDMGIPADQMKAYAMSLKKGRYPKMK